MPASNMAWDKVIASVAAASMIGGGTMVLSSHRENSVQATQIEHMKERQQRTDDAISRLDEAVRSLDKNVAVLNEQMQE